MSWYRVEIFDDLKSNLIGWLTPIEDNKVHFTKKKDWKDATEKERKASYPVYRYKDYSRRSGVYAYAYSPGKDIIYIYFTGKKRGWYKYDIESAPEYVINNMIKKAKKGYGLNRYINKHPRTYYWKGAY